MIPFIFWAMIVVLIFLILAFITGSYPIGMLSAIAMIIVGVYILSLGIEGIDNILSLAAGVIYTCLGIYIFIYGTIQEYEEVF